jgi:hypothetical protein
MGRSHAIRDPRSRSLRSIKELKSAGLSAWRNGGREGHRGIPLSTNGWPNFAIQPHLIPELRKKLACIQRVDPVRLAEAVSRYVDWEALAYWARPALERESELPKVVLEVLRDRCPEFLKTEHRPWDWQRLMTWISDHYFPDAKKEGWLDALLVRAGDHPPAIRTREYADHCEETWGSRIPDPFPSFEEWRRDADSYVEPPRVLPSASNS